MKNFKNISIYLLVILLAISLIGCAPKEVVEEDLIVEDIQDVEEVVSEYPMEIEDEFGNKETIEEEPMKIVSLAPSNTEILFSLGLGDKVAGVTSYCDYPEEAATKEIIGGYSQFNLEKIIELEPDLVLAYGPGDEGEKKALRDAGIKVLGFGGETIDEVINDMKIIGKITGNNKEAEEVTAAMILKKNEIVEKIKGQEKVKVFYEIWHEPLQAAGEGSFMGELLILVGAENVAVDEDDDEIEKQAYPIFDLEQLIERDPEVYLTSADMPEKTIEAIKERPGYGEITAIKNDRVYIFDGDEANIVSRPGPRIVEALEIIARSIHPKLFE